MSGRGLNFSLQLPDVYGGGNNGAANNDGKNYYGGYGYDPQGGISDMPKDPRAGASEIADKSQGMYDEDARKADITEHDSAQDRYVDDYTLSPEQWFKMYGFWNWNLAKDNPNGNLNNRTFGTTLRQSRLADALNNQRHWKAAKIGRRTNSGFGTNEYQEGHSERWEPIDTQEMRQMRANERVDEEARSRQVSRAENVQDYPLELRKQADQLKARLANYQAQTGVDLSRYMQRGVFDMEYTQSWQTWWTNFVTKFATELGLNVKDRIFQKILKLDYPFSQTYAYLHSNVSIPNPVLTSAYEYLEQMTSGIKDPYERNITYQTGLAALANQTWGSINMGFQGGVGLPTAKEQFRKMNGQ